MKMKRLKILLGCGSSAKSSKISRSSIMVSLDEMHENILNILKDDGRTEEEVELDLREKRARVEHMELQNESTKAMTKQMEMQ